MLDGFSGQYRIWLVINKFLNHSLIPFLGYFVIHIWVRHSKYDRLLAVLLPGNVLFQLASIATGWTFSIDQNNHYYQGRYYYVYFIICIIVMFAIVSAYHQFEQKTFSGDRLFMFYTFFVVFLGIVIQEVSGEALRTTLLTIAIRTCFLLNRFNNFTQKISRDNVVMRTDIMTGIVKARRLTVCACLGYLKLVFRGNYYVYDFVFDFTDIFNYCGRAGGDRRFSAQGLV
ncbi:hypothetical protein LOB24_07675 [Lactobacillus delbrueckii subsp. lactis]|uniref:Uncharacterized protein n=3 Tax=Lactobacillus delbrueckii TaxID=1584 RepID=A0A4Q7DWK1_9LACO|nr:hypothetical protein [Lactobacillus delbrueckii]MCD5444217.1 hypothetical protein [Lactobacillus delbrueckii subsp. lactis]MCD5494548.1 hypothetical protein [Lactobacillus delbrueckii subsp. lactis]MCD5510399.1 hypothetical protein [Lactobacillus delbrueckii subsp. lactis]MCD5512220.1 hypothetical protein [Lactobacillus delbrueckii subsp. lactis]MCD5515811.1 hypothetical protein [Lactobacillus delbrueckii subsp. lactis]